MSERDGVHVRVVSAEETLAMKSAFRADFERFAGMTLEDAVWCVRSCGCCYDAPDHLDDDWFDDQLRTVRMFFPELDDLRAEAAQRRQDADPDAGR